ncbi:SCO-spondin, partial [Stegodyphus mimosarum]
MNEKDEQEINIQSLKSDIGINKTHLLKYTTINSYTAPTENVELIDVLLLDHPDFKNESISNTTVKDNLKPFFNSTEESEDISMVTSTISHILHKSGNVTNEANESDSMISVHLNNSQQMQTLNIAEVITEKEDSYDSNENSAITTEDISLYISELNMTEKAPSLVTHSASETKLHTIKELGESLNNNFSMHTLEGHGFYKPHFSLTTMSPANNAEKYYVPTSQSAAAEELTTHHNFVKSSDTLKEVTISKDKITTSTPDLSGLDTSKLTLNSDSIDSSAVYTDASAYGSSQNVEDGSLSTVNHQINDEITSFPAVQSNETSENISTDTSDNLTSSDALITNRNEDGLNVTTVILSGVPKIVPQFPALHFNPNDIESDDGGIIELDDDLMHEQQTTQSDQDTIKDKTEIIRHITTLAPTTVMPVSLGKYPVFISKSCSEDEMLCDSGECVESNSRCNMRRDCRDNSDEKNCTCTDLLKVLGQSQKICDGVEDCQDRSDEQNCPWCKAGQYICPQTKFCINRTQVCDGHDDCPLGNDEKYCVRLAESVPDAESLHYRSSGYLMVRKKGQWGKLCLESVQDSLVLRRKLDELGKAVCTTLTYKDMSESKRVHDTTVGSEFYYEISSEASREV